MLLFLQSCGFEAFFFAVHLLKDKNAEEPEVRLALRHPQEPCLVSIMEILEGLTWPRAAALCANGSGPLAEPRFWHRCMPV